MMNAQRRQQAALDLGFAIEKLAGIATAQSEAQARRLFEDTMVVVERYTLAELRELGPACEVLEDMLRKAPSFIAIRTALANGSDWRRS